MPHNELSVAVLPKQWRLMGRVDGKESIKRFEDECSLFLLHWNDDERHLEFTRDKNAIEVYQTRAKGTPVDVRLLKWKDWGTIYINTVLAPNASVVLQCPIMSSLMGIPIYKSTYIVFCKKPKDMHHPGNHLDPLCLGCTVKLGIKACSKCHYAMYCSRECQVADYKQHKRQCNVANFVTDWGECPFALPDIAVPIPSLMHGPMQARFSTTVPRTAGMKLIQTVENQVPLTL